MPRSFRVFAPSPFRGSLCLAMAMKLNRVARRSFLQVIYSVVACAIAAAAWGATADSPLPGTVKSAPDVVIYQGVYPAWPWIDRTSGGTLLCVWREGTQHMYSANGKVMLSKSGDGGKTWSAATTIVDAPTIDDRNTAILAISDSDWLVCYNTFTRDSISCSMTLRTSDAGRTWSKPQPLSAADTRTRAAAIKLSTGELLLPYYKAPGNGSLAALSNDNGRTWTTVEIANTAELVGDEWSAIELPDGRLAGIIRNSAPSTDGSLFVTTSRDRGRTWSVPRRTNLRDQQSTSPAHIFLHQGKPWVLYDDARMVSVALATTDDPNLLVWNVAGRLKAFQYRADGKPIVDGGYPASAATTGKQRLIVDYVIDGDRRAIVGYFVTMP
jgi:predicted neuraminidase